MKRPLVYSLVALAVLGLSVVPVGTAVFVLGFGAGDSPCVMCWEQRIGMLLIALLGLFVLRYGPKPKYVGLSVLVSTWGIFMALRHTAMHAARDVGQGFSVEILGAHTYTWALLIYWVCAVTMGLLLLITREEDLGQGMRMPRGLERLAMWVFLVVVAGNVVQAFASTGPPPFLGQSDPVRFSFNPRHWAWSLEEWKPSAVSLRGRWAVSKPDERGLNPAPGAGPFSDAPRLIVTNERRLALGFRGGRPTGLAYDPTTDRFAISTEQGVHLVDASFTRILRQTVIDGSYSVDLARLADVAFLDPHTVAAISENKSYVILREAQASDVGKNFRYFLESFDAFDELSRSRLSTVRARMMYTQSLAFDLSSQSLYTVTVPNEKAGRLVVSRFDRADMTLSEEFTPGLAQASASPRGGSSLDRLYVTAATARDGVLYALSAAHSTLLAIDVAQHRVVAAYTMPPLDRPVGLATKGNEFYVLCRDARLLVAAIPPIPARPAPSSADLGSAGRPAF